MIVKQRCWVCLRHVTRTKNGRGFFRRHTINKGELCPGSWRYPHETMDIARKLRASVSQSQFLSGYGNSLDCLE